MRYVTHLLQSSDADSSTLMCIRVITSLDLVYLCVCVCMCVNVCVCVCERAEDFDLVGLKKGHVRKVQVGLKNLMIKDGPDSEKSEDETADSAREKTPRSSSKTKPDAERDEEDFATKQGELLDKMKNGQRVNFVTVQATFGAMSPGNTDGDQNVFHATKNNHPRIAIFPSKFPGMILLLGKHSFTDESIGFKWMRMCSEIDQVCEYVSNYCRHHRHLTSTRVKVLPMRSALLF